MKIITKEQLKKYNADKNIRKEYVYNVRLLNKELKDARKIGNDSIYFYIKNIQYTENIKNLKQHITEAGYYLEEKGEHFIIVIGE